MIVTQNEVKKGETGFSTTEQVWGETGGKYADETLGKTAERYSDAFWASAEENIVSSKAAVSLYQAGEAIGEDIAYLVSGNKKDPNFNPLDYIEGYEDYVDSFIDCDTALSVDRVKRRIDAENRNLEAMSKVPVGVNLINNLITGFLDPVNLIPVGGQALKAKGFIEGAIKGGGVALGTSAIQEFVLKEMSYNYTDDEYTQNVLVGTIFGAGISGSVAKLGAISDALKKADYDKTLKDRIDLMRKNSFDDEFQVKKGEAIDNFSKLNDDEILTYEGQESTVGAAQVNKVATEVADAGKIGNWIIALERKWNPVLHMSTSISRKVREVANQLFEMPFYTRNVQDSFNLESTTKKNIQEVGFLNKDIETEYAKYYTDDKYKDTFVENLRIAFGETKAIESGKLSRADFDKAVTDVAESGKKSGNIYIDSSAEKFRALADIQAERMRSLYDRGLIEAKPMKNWVPFVFDKDAIISNTDEFVSLMSDQMKAQKDDIMKLNADGKSKYDLTNESIVKEQEFINNAEAQNRNEISPEIKKLNSREYFLKNDIQQTEGQIHEIEIDIDKRLRSESKTKNRIFMLDKDIDIPTDKDFAKQIKNGIPKDLEPKSISSDVISRDFLIDDVEGYLPKEYREKYSVQAYKGGDIDSKNVVSWDELGEMYWQDGWYQERPYTQDFADEFVSDLGGINKKYHQDSEKILRRQYDIDVARDALGRLGYNYERMKPEEIDNLLTDLGNKGYLKKAYVDKARVAELEKISKEKRKEIDDKLSRFKHLKEKLSSQKEELGLIRNDLQAKRRLRNMNKDDIKASKKKLKSLEKTQEYQRKLVQTTDEDLLGYARDLTNDIIGVKKIGATIGDAEIADRGSLLSRDFLTTPSEALKKFTVREMTKLLPALRREMVDLSVIEKFGSLNMDSQRADILDSYARKRSKYEALRRNKPEMTSEINKKLLHLDKERDADLDFMSMAVNRMRGTEYSKGNYSKGVVKTTEFAKLYNMTTSLGNVVLSSISDVAGNILHTSIKSALPAMRLFKSIFNPQLAGELSKTPALNHAIIEVHSNFRSLNFAEMTQNDIINTSKMRSARGYADVYMHITGLPRWNMLTKAISGHAFMNELGSLVNKLDSGLALNSKQSMWLKRFGFDDNTIDVIRDSIKKYGVSEGGNTYLNSHMWDNKVVAEQVQLAINKYMDIAIVTPGAEKAKAFNDPILSTLLQFKQFGLSSVSRTLIPALQTSGNYDTAMGLLTAWTLGCASIMAKDAVSGRERSAGDYILEGFAQAGIAGWIEEPYKLANAVTRGGADRLWYAASGGYLGQESMSPYEANRDMLNVLGPSFGKLKNLAGFIGDVSSGNINKSSMYKLKSLIPMQNLIGVNQTLQGVIESMYE